MKNIIKSSVLSIIFAVSFGGCNSFPDKITNSLLPGGEGRISGSKKSIENKNDEIQISLSLTEFRVGIDEPVFLEFKVQNKTKQTLNLDLGQDYKGGFLFAVILPDGKEIKIPQYAKGGISAIGEVTIQPNDTYSRKILFNDWFIFESPGEYILKGQLAYPIKVGDQEVVIKDSRFDTTINVHEKSVEKLERTSAALYHQVLGTSNYEQKANAAHALGYVNDPVAVPYLEKLLMIDIMVDSIVINGLVRIGGKASVDVMNNAIKRDPQSRIAALSRSALENMKRPKSDPGIEN